MKAPGVRVPRDEGEAARRRLAEEGRLRQDLKPLRQPAHLVLPVAGAPADGEFEFEPAPGRPRGYQDLVDAPPDVKARLPTSFDVIGHVVVVKIPEEVEAWTGAIADALLAVHPGARTVAVDRGVAGDFRVRDLDVVRGDPETETWYVESGMRLRVDPARAYFSPRLGTERARVASLVRPGEVVVDLFAGVGPWSILIAKRARPALVHAVDLNPEAVRLLRENVAGSHVEGVVVPHLADAREFAAAHRGEADRAIANLPHGAAGFFEDASRLLKPGGTLHHHAILDPADAPAHLRSLAARAEAIGRRASPLGERVVRAYSPSERHVAFDLRID